MKRTVVVVLEVEPRDSDGGWAFATRTLREILERLLATAFARRWDYRFKVVSIHRVDEED